MNQVITVSCSLNARGIADSFARASAPIVDDRGSICVLLGNVFLHGTREDFAALVDGLQSMLDKLEPAPACSNCGETTGQPIEHIGATDPQTGYHDVAQGCTECAK